MRVLLWCGVLASLFGVSGVTPSAQEWLTISGQVVVITGARLPAVAVTARRPSGLAVDAVVSDAAGRFVLRLPEPGDYTVSALLAGFAVTENTITANALPVVLMC